MRDYVLGEEEYKDGGRHFHVILISDRKVDIRSTSKFDIVFKGRRYHCNIQPVRDLAGAVRYVCKDKRYLTNLKHIYDGELQPLEKLLSRMAEREGKNKTLQYYAENFPSQALGSKSLANIEKFLTLLSEVKRKNEMAMERKMYSPFTLENFNLPPVIIQWLKDGLEPPLIIIGPPGCGKTQFIKALITELGLNAHTTEGIKFLSPEHEILVLDDCSLQDLNDSATLALLETCEDQIVRVMHGSVCKRKGLK